MIALIMAGGSGTRFWPASRMSLPKQFLRIAGDKSMLRLTFERLTPLIPAEHVYVVTAASQASLVRGHLPELPEGNVIIEPFGMNTAPCIALSLACLERFYPSSETMVVLPADHVIRDSDAFLDSLKKAQDIAEKGYLVTFGIVPEYPATGYGYIEAGEEFAPGTFAVSRFKEKPDHDTAVGFISQGNFFWNSGMFCWTLAAIGEAFASHLPLALETGRRICELEGNEELINETYRRMPRTPIDIGIMEPAAKRAVIPVSYGWSDVGSWKALADITPANGDGNIFTAPGYSQNAQGNYVHSHKFVALLGVENLCVVETEDAILVTSRDQSEGVKNVVEWLKQNHKEELL
jgi:mannose-1-phosphate guanylyltransferase